MIAVRPVLVAFGALWAAALAYAAAGARVLYGDGAWFLLVHLITPHRFNDYDFQRTFASYVSQAPILLGQRLGFDSSAAYAALYAVGIFWIPAACLFGALVLARRQPLLFAANAAACVVWGFGTSFINTEANLLFVYAWLAATILSIEGRAPLLRGVLLPLTGVAMLRTYEGMLLAGPVLALWAIVCAQRSSDEGERFGMRVAALLFAIGAVIGLGGFLAPRDIGNAGGFVASALNYLRNPHAWQLAAALAAAVAIVRAGRVRVALAVASAVFGAIFVAGIWRLQGYYGFEVYYQNRSFLALSLPGFLAMLCAVYLFRPHWLAAAPSRAYGIALIPLASAIAGDMLGTHRWREDMATFCRALDASAAPPARLEMLKAGGVRTAWPWTHPSMSLLLRPQGSTAVVFNEPNQRFEPFNPASPPQIPYRGICEAPLLGPGRTTGGIERLAFTGGSLPGHVRAVRGLSAPEPWGTWTDGPVAEVEFARPLPRDFDLAMRVNTAWGPNRELPIRVRAGGVEREFRFESEPYEAQLEFRGVGDTSKLEIHIPRPQSPLEAGKGADPRKLGIGLVWLSVRPRPAGEVETRNPK